VAHPTNSQETAIVSDNYDAETGGATIVSANLTVSANLVEEESTTDIALTSIHEEENKCKAVMCDRRGWLLAIALFGVICGAVAGIIAWGNGKEDSQAEAATQHYDELLDLLAAHSPNGGTNLFDPHSEQFKAFVWLHNDPSVTAYSDSRKLARYALATFFNAAGGSEWKKNQGWMDYDVHECNWVGVACENVAQGNVEKITIDNNMLTGKLVSELAMLSHLRE
jgi:hypothetical protein